jgi:predicted nucleotide-binding protein
MAKLPIEVISVNQNFEFSRELNEAVEIANSLQQEFVFQLISETEGSPFSFLSFNVGKSEEIMDNMETIREKIKGYHPFILLIMDTKLDGKDFGNIFGSNRAEKGLGVLTTFNVPDIIVPHKKMVSYFLYYFARYTLSYIIPTHKNHNDTRGCIYDRKINKEDIIHSMKARAFCDDCRRALLSLNSTLTPNQLSALDKIFDVAGKNLEENTKKAKKPSLFIGSSSEGLPIANKIQMLLENDVDCEIWNQGTFSLGESYLESLENAVKSNDFGVFVFTPDDTIESRGEVKKIARDNVIFELGLFVGKLTRKKAFIVHPKGKDIHILSDFSGITIASYDPENKNLLSALGIPCEKIRQAIQKINAL